MPDIQPDHTIPPVVLQAAWESFAAAEGIDPDRAIPHAGYRAAIAVIRQWLADALNADQGDGYDIHGRPAGVRHDAHTVTVGPRPGHAKGITMPPVHPTDTPEPDRGPPAPSGVSSTSTTVNRRPGHTEPPCPACVAEAAAAAPQPGDPDEPREAIGRLAHQAAIQAMNRAMGSDDDGKPPPRYDPPFWWSWDGIGPDWRNLFMAAGVACWDGGKHLGRRDLIAELTHQVATWQAYADTNEQRRRTTPSVPDQRFWDGRASAFAAVAEEITTRLDEITGRREPRHRADLYPHTQPATLDDTSPGHTGPDALQP